MRIAFLVAALILAGPAMAEDTPGTFTTNTINGVRVWSPKPSPKPAYVPPPQQTIVIESQAPAPVQTYEPGLPYYPVPFLVGPRFPHPHVRPERPTPTHFGRPGRRF
jgi:hypothetical protein